MSASRSKGIPKEIFAVRSFQGLASLSTTRRRTQTDDDDDSLFGSSSNALFETSNNTSRRSRKSVNLMDILTELDLPAPKTPLDGSEATRRKLGKLYSTMPILKPERRRSTEMSPGFSTGNSSKNASFGSPQAYKKKPNMFESFEMTPTSLMSLGHEHLSQKKMSSPTMGMMSLHDMLPMMHTYGSNSLAPKASPSNTLKKLSRSELLGCTSKKKMKHRSLPRNMKHPTLSRATSVPASMASSSMPLTKPMRKRSMEHVSPLLNRKKFPSKINHPSLKRATSVPVEMLTKPMRKASMEHSMNTSSHSAGRPRRIEPITSPHRIEVPSPTMPLTKPRRKASMDHSPMRSSSRTSSTLSPMMPQRKASLSNASTCSTSMASSIVTAPLS